MLVRAIMSVPVVVSRRAIGEAGWRAARVSIARTMKRTVCMVY